MRDPSGHSVNFDSFYNEPEFESEFFDLEECIRSGQHLVHTDDDGFCDLCGFAAEEKGKSSE